MTESHLKLTLAEGNLLPPVMLKSVDLTGMTRRRQDCVSPHRFCVLPHHRQDFPVLAGMCNRKLQAPFCQPGKQRKKGCFILFAFPDSSSKNQQGRSLMWLAEFLQHRLDQSLWTRMKFYDVSLARVCAGWADSMAAQRGCSSTKDGQGGCQRGLLGKHFPVERVAVHYT